MTREIQPIKVSIPLERVNDILKKLKLLPKSERFSPAPIIEDCPRKPGEKHKKNKPTADRSKIESGGLNAAGYVKIHNAPKALEKTHCPGEKNSKIRYEPEPLKKLKIRNGQEILTSVVYGKTRVEATPIRKTGEEFKTTYQKPRNEPRVRKSKLTQHPDEEVKTDDHVQRPGDELRRKTSKIRNEAELPKKLKLRNVPDTLILKTGEDFKTADDLQKHRNDLRDKTSEIRNEAEPLKKLKLRNVPDTLIRKTGEDFKRADDLVKPRDELREKKAKLIRPPEEEVKTAANPAQEPGDELREKTSEIRNEAEPLKKLKLRNVPDTFIRKTNEEFITPYPKEPRDESREKKSKIRNEPDPPKKKPKIRKVPEALDVVQCKPKQLEKKTSETRDQPDTRLSNTDESRNKQELQIFEQLVESQVSLTAQLLTSDSEICQEDLMLAVRNPISPLPNSERSSKFDYCLFKSLIPGSEYAPEPPSVPRLVYAPTPIDELKLLRWSEVSENRPVGDEVCHDTSSADIYMQGDKNLGREKGAPDATSMEPNSPEPTNLLGEDCLNINTEDLDLELLPPLPPPSPNKAKLKSSSDHTDEDKLKKDQHSTRPFEARLKSVFNRGTGIKLISPPKEYPVMKRKQREASKASWGEESRCHIPEKIPRLEPTAGWKRDILQSFTDPRSRRILYIDSMVENDTCYWFRALTSDVYLEGRGVPFDLISGSNVYEQNMSRAAFQHFQQKNNPLGWRVRPSRLATFSSEENITPTIVVGLNLEEHYSNWRLVKQFCRLTPVEDQRKGLNLCCNCYQTDSTAHYVTRRTRKLYCRTHAKELKEEFMLYLPQLVSITLGEVDAVCSALNPHGFWSVLSSVKLPKTAVYGTADVTCLQEICLAFGTRRRPGWWQYH